MKNEIDNKYFYEINVLKSKFIAILFPVTNKNHFIEELNLIKKNNLKARHFCYAYIINDEIKFSDDGEPKNSAGKPIYNNLINNNLNNIGLVVIRYFGGTLLGSGRLTRTYNEASKEVIKLAKLIQYIEVKKYEITIELNIYNTFINYCNKNNLTIESNIFGEHIDIILFSSLDFNEDIVSIFYPKLKINKIEKTYKKNE
ncbi:MAG: IMPACT family protein [Bacillales bacterium]